jgi:hypothetical protein
VKIFLFNLELSVPVGVIVSKPTIYQLMIGKESIRMDGHHLYQRGEIYQSFPWNLQEELDIKLKFFAPGVNTHAVLRLPSGEGLTLTGKFPPSLDFKLFE